MLTIIAMITKTTMIDYWLFLHCGGGGRGEIDYKRGGWSRWQWWLIIDYFFIAEEGWGGGDRSIIRGVGAMVAVDKFLT
jgi:hypothetical protein